MDVYVPTPFEEGRRMVARRNKSWGIVNKRAIKRFSKIEACSTGYPRVKTFRTTSVTDFMNLVRKFVKPLSRHVIRPDENVLGDINK